MIGFTNVVQKLLPFWQVYLHTIIAITKSLQMTFSIISTFSIFIWHLHTYAVPTIYNIIRGFNAKLYNS